MSVDLKEAFQESLGVYLANWKVGALAGALQLIPVAGGLVFVNWMSAVKRNEAVGESVGLPGLLDSDDAIEKVMGSFGLLVLATITAALGAFLPWMLGLPLSLGSMVGMIVLAGMVAFSNAIMADKPGLSFLNALAGTWAFTRKQPGLMLKLIALCAALFVAGCLALVIGLIVTVPLAAGLVFNVYKTVRTDVEAAAAADGVELQ